MSEHRSPDETEDRALLEAALFLASQPLTRRALAGILGGVQAAYVDRLLAELEQEFGRQEHGLELRLDEGRAGFRVKTRFLDRVAHLAPQQDIPRPILRSLAVIAYNHPMLQSDLVKVRGNKAYGHVQELLARRLIRAEETGRTLLLYVTKEFLRHFGLDTVEEFRFHVGGMPGLETESDVDEADERPEAQPRTESAEDETAIAPAQTPSGADDEDAPESGPEGEQEAEPEAGREEDPVVSEGGG